LAAGETDTGGIDSRRGWFVVASAFGATFIVFGVAYSFGAFFEPMAEEFGSGSGATSAFFGITTFVYFALGLFSGRAVDRFGPRPLLLISAFVMGAGLLLTSQVNSLTMGYLTYGGGVGIGVACAYVPMVATVGAWFERRRALALALAVTGIGLGTLLMAPLAAWLIEEVGWRDTYVIFGIASAAVLVVCALLAAPPPSAGGDAVALPLGQVVRQPPFRWLYLSALLMSVVLFVPFVFLPSFAEERGVGSVAAAALVGIIGAASVIGRLGLGVLGGRLGTVRVYQATFFCLGLSFLIWLVGGGSYSVLVIFAIVMGTAYGGFIALSPAVTAEKFGAVGLGGVIGALYTSAAVGGLLGPPAAGALIDGVGFQATIVVAMVIGFFAFAATLPLSRLERVSVPIKREGATAATDAQGSETGRT
jgi:MFS family permease